MSPRHLQTPTSPHPPRRGGVGSTPACDSTPGAGRATTAEVEGARIPTGLWQSVSRAIPRWSWALVDGLGRFVREQGLVALLAVAVPAAGGLALALAVARRGVAW